MNAVAQAQLTRVESALDALVDSITTYNPSPSTATHLLALDADLTAGLDTLSAHQRNARTLAQLRATSDQLDRRIKSTLATLADTRKDLLSRAPPSPPSGAATATTTSAPGPDYALLLSTAQRIAPYTRPAFQPLRPTLPAAAAAPSEPTQSTADATEPGSQAQLGRAAPAVLDEQQQAMLDPGAAAAAMFTPWPSEVVIWAGALGRLQHNEQSSQQRVVEGAAAPIEAAREEAEAETRPVNGEVDDGLPTRTSETQQELGGEALERRRAEAEARRRQQEEELGAFELYNPDED